jgi:hypothetical protein
MIIIGAGLAGLLAGNMLRGREFTIREQAEALPNNHSAVLRFRTGVIGTITGTQFNKVTVIKETICDRGGMVEASLRYSRKCTGVYRSDRSLPIAPERCERFIAPKDLISQMAGKISEHITFNSKVSYASIISAGCPVISTMPMPTLMSLLDYPGPRPKFNFTNGINIRARVPRCDAYASVYDARRGQPSSRISITGDELIIEVPNPEAATDRALAQASFLRPFATECASILGINLPTDTHIEVVKQKYAKILPVDDDDRLAFIHWATDKFCVYSLGRFATWRPGLLLDDLVNDVQLIDTWTKKGRYHAALHR